MQRKVLLLLICAAFLLLPAGCAGGQSTVGEEPTAAPAEETPAPAGDYTYAEAYMRYLSVCSALRDTVDRRVETHNAILKSRDPDSYYMNSDYLMLVYVPFSTAYPALGSALGRDNRTAAENALRETFPDAALTQLDEDSWQAVYTYLDKTSGEEVPRQGKCVWECEYLLYTMTDKALVRFTDGEVPAFWHAHRISEPPMDAFAGDMRLCSLEEKDFYPSASAGVSWITGDKDAQFVLTLENSVMTYTGKIGQDILTKDGERTSVQWLDIEPITLLG